MRIPSDHLEARPRPDAPSGSAPPIPAAEPAPAPVQHNGSALQEIGGPRGLEPTRYGDWERNGRCIDF